MCPVKEHFEKQLQEREAEVSSKIPRKAFLKELTELQNMPFWVIPYCKSSTYPEKRRNGLEAARDTDDVGVATQALICLLQQIFYMRGK